jgi:UDP-N-acetylmuramate: L-alanyl-gamma-D-glutamyl-meso-diaminopimelate ligase
LPNDVILTSVEFDHADIYADLAAVKKAFSGLISRIRPEGRLIACIETENVRELIRESKVPVVTYSRHASDQADYTFSKLETTSEGIRFSVHFKGNEIDQLGLTLPGEHNALNALAVYIECKAIGLTSGQIQQGLQSFKGIKRRQEERGEVREVLVIDDFAHHPTAVRETLKALRSKYQGRRLISVFEPRSATSRRKVFQREYAEAFDLADEVMIATAFDQSKIPSDQQFSSEELVEDLKKRGGSALSFSSVEEGVRIVANQAKAGDVVAVLSNGGFGGFIPKLLEALR